jgi:cytochrome c oxidase cbb3-type subunit 3/ubiquinol-cytochrome c reductase cytochrome c subunit
MRLLPLSFLAVALSSLGCGSPTTTPDAASEPIADAGLDAASVTIDAPLERDAPASPDASAPDAFDPSGDASVIERGRALYGTHCALCHAADATGYAADDAPAIGRDDFLVLADDAFLEIAVHDGRPGTPMSAWGDEHGGPFTREDSRHVVAFLRSLQVAPSEDLSGITVSGDATRGSVVFARECASCHGPEGEGVSAVTLDNAVFQDSVSDGFLRRSIERGRRETPMPGFAGTLTPQQIDDVVAFVRTLRREPMPEWPIEDAPT